MKIYLLVFILFLSSLFIAGMYLIYVQNRRFTTIFTDMLPWYPYLLILNIIIVTIVDIILFQKYPMLSGLFYGGFFVVALIQFRQFYEWKQSYRLFRYSDFLQNICAEESINVVTWDDWIKNPQNDPKQVTIYIRHDVDISLKRARQMFAIEQQLGIASGYFFRNNAERYQLSEAEDFMKQLDKDPNYTVGFHYETIANASGDLQKASQLFGTELEYMRTLAKIPVIAAHGDRYHNRRLQTEGLLNLEKHDLSCAYELYHDLYISDAGGKHDFKEILHQTKITEQLHACRSVEKGTVIQILIHSDWWF